MWTTILLTLATVIAPERGRPAEPTSPPVIVELFTSQGCMACPAANAKLVELAQTENILPLTWSVDHWDYLGWEDTLAQPDFVQRQKAYAKALDTRMVYTPQFVIGGAQDVSGKRLGKVETAILNASWTAQQVALSTPAMTVRRNGDVLAVSVGAGGPIDARVILAEVAFGETDVAIGAGDNAGKTVTHVNVVTAVEDLGAWTGAAADFTTTLDANADGVVMLQAAGGGPILAAMTVR